VNEVFLAYLGRLSTHFTGSEKQLLDGIANQCPLSGGRAVFEARALLAAESGQWVAYDDDNLCNAGGAFNAPQADGHIEHDKIRLYPNPAKQQTTIQWGQPLEGEGLLEVYDAYGRLQKSVVLEAGSNNYNLLLHTLETGLYFIRLNLDGEVADFKLIVH